MVGTFECSRALSDAGMLMLARRVAATSSPYRKSLLMMAAVVLRSFS
jgi:hypothetical protein